MSEEYTQLLHRGSGGSMYTRKAHATREAPMRGLCPNLAADIDLHETEHTNNRSRERSRSCSRQGDSDQVSILVVCNG